MVNQHFNNGSLNSYYHIKHNKKLGKNNCIKTPALHTKEKKIPRPSKLRMHFDINKTSS